MEYKCSICHTMIENDLKAYSDHVDQHIVDIVKQEHPEWIEGDGLCPKCFEYYKSQMKGD